MTLKIAIVAPSPVPILEGGAERLWRSLAAGLTDAGHQADIITLPFPETTLAEVIAGYRAFRQLDLSAFDVIVSGKYPGWMVSHPCHIVYMLHPLRGLYETFPAHLTEALPPEESGVEARIAQIGEIDELLDYADELLARWPADHPMVAHPSALGRLLVRRLDQLAFAGDQIRHLAAISDEVASRPGYFPADRAVQVVHPVSDLPTQSLDVDDLPEWVETAEGPVLFTASRHDGPKRIDLIIDAFRHLTDGHNDRQMSLVIAGDGPERANLEKRAGANERIEFLGRVSEEELGQRYRTADAVVFTPQHEDFGYVTLEAMLLGTPVITTTDAGGAGELLADGVGGIVVDPTVVALADAFDQIADNPHLRWQLGLNGRRRAARVSWAPLVSEIEAAAQSVLQASIDRPSVNRPSVVMVSTFGVDPMVGGGQRRLRALARSLAEHADVTIVALTARHDTETIRRRVIDPGITQIEVPRSGAHLRAEAEITRVAGLPVDDITCGPLWPSTPAFGRELDRLLPTAGVVVADHPFLAPAIIDRLAALNLDTPLVYDSHNAETPFKASMLEAAATSPSARTWLNRAVQSAEHDAVVNAALITACTVDDLASFDTPASIPTIVVPNGVDTAAMPERDPNDHVRARAEALGLFNFSDDEQRLLGVFVGSWHPPNLEAAHLIVELATARPDWIFGLAGSHTLGFDTAAMPPNLRLLPQFAEESLWPIIAGADVALNPMLSGGGSNLKLYDYLSVGVPVLTTDIGSRGLDDAESTVWVGMPTAQGMSDGLDAIDNASKADLGERQRRGRAYADQADWRLLGSLWSEAVLEHAGLETVAEPRSRQPDHRPFLADTTPPPTSPTLELMKRLGTAALSPSPPPEATAMNPNLRETLKRMTANRHAGRELPVNARLKLPKKALIRAGEAFTNEQLVFNEATVDAVTQLTEQVAALEARLASLEDKT